MHAPFLGINLLYKLQHRPDFIQLLVMNICQSLRKNLNLEVLLQLCVRAYLSQKCFHA